MRKECEHNTANNTICFIYIQLNFAQRPHVLCTIFMIHFSSHEIYTEQPEYIIRLFVQQDRKFRKYTYVAVYIGSVLWLKNSLVL